MIVEERSRVFIAALTLQVANGTTQDGYSPCLVSYTIFEGVARTVELLLLLLHCDRAISTKLDGRFRFFRFIPGLSTELSILLTVI